MSIKTENFLKFSIFFTNVDKNLQAMRAAARVVYWFTRKRRFLAGSTLKLMNAQVSYEKAKHCKNCGSNTVFAVQIND